MEATEVLNDSILQGVQTSNPAAKKEACDDKQYKHTVCR